MLLNLIFILILNACFKSEIVLPIKTLPLENYKLFNNNKTNFEKIINPLYQTQFYTIIQMGQPLQTIPLLIKFEPNLLIITSINSIKNSSSYKYRDTFNFSESFFITNNFKYYDEKKSGTFILNKCDYGKFYEAEEICDCNETFLFYEDLELTKNVKKEKIFFNLVRNAEDNITGEIGLNLYDTNKRSFNSFLNTLKKHKLINNYNWYFDFNNKTNETKLIIGALPHEMHPLLYSEDDLMYSKSESSNYMIYWKLWFNKIFAFNSDLYASLKYFDETTVELKYDIDFIIGTNEFENYLFNVLDEYIFGNKCFLGRINDYKNITNKLKFFYCKNERYIFEELYGSLLPTIFLYSYEFNYTFEIDSDDLLMIKDDFIYLRIVFSEKGNKIWKLGKIFTMKYKFIFNPETKQVGFYLKQLSGKNTTKEKNNKISYKDSEFRKNLIYKLLIIIFLSILLTFLIAKYYKSICNITRQKRKNEITLINDYKYYEKNNVKEMMSLQNNNDNYQ